jgi:hypothetical protein
MKTKGGHRGCKRCKMTGESSTPQCPKCAGMKKPCQGEEEEADCLKRQGQWNKALRFDPRDEQETCKLVAINDKCFSQKLFNREAGVEEVIDYHANYYLKAPKGKSLVIIWGAGWHTLAALKNVNDDSPRGVLVAKERIENTNITIADVIDDVKNVTSCKVRVNGNKVALSPADVKSRKRKVISWLKSLSDSPQFCKVAIVRQLKTVEGVDVKPAWAAQLLKELNAKRSSQASSPLPVASPRNNRLRKPKVYLGLFEYILDIGSDKLAFTDIKGNQLLNCDFDADLNIINSENEDEKFTMRQYIQVFKGKKRGLDLRKVAVRFTGKFRQIGTEARRTKKEEFIRMLQEENITDIETLENSEEARLGSMHCLSLVEPYYPEVNNFVVNELGGGSHQGAEYQRIQHKIRGNAIDNMHYFSFSNKNRFGGMDKEAESQSRQKLMSNLRNMEDDYQQGLPASIHQRRQQLNHKMHRSHAMNERAGTVLRGGGFSNERPMNELRTPTKFNGLYDMGPNTHGRSRINNFTGAGALVTEDSENSEEDDEKKPSTEAPKRRKPASKRKVGRLGLTMGKSSAPVKPTTPLKPTLHRKSAEAAGSAQPTTAPAKQEAKTPSMPAVPSPGKTKESKPEPKAKPALQKWVCTCGAKKTKFAGTRKVYC